MILKIKYNIAHFGPSIDVVLFSQTIGQLEVERCFVAVVVVEELLAQHGVEVAWGDELAHQLDEATLAMEISHGVHGMLPVLFLKRHANGADIEAAHAIDRKGVMRGLIACGQSQVSDLPIQVPTHPFGELGQEREMLQHHLGEVELGAPPFGHTHALRVPTALRLLLAEATAQPHLLGVRQITEDGFA